MPVADLFCQMRQVDIPIGIRGTAQTSPNTQLGGVQVAASV